MQVESNTQKATEITEEVALESDISEEAVKERRYLWMARTFALVSVVSFLVNVLLLFAVFSLVPLMRVQPFYLSTQDKDQQIIRVVRPRIADLNTQVLGESFIRQYLLARFTVGTNIPSLENTWGIDGLVYHESASSVFQEFLQTSNGLIELAKKDGFTRGVRILTVVQLSTEKDGSEIWQAEMEFGDMRRGASEPKYTKWRAILYIAFDPVQENLEWSNRLKNPLGFKVRRFGLEELKE